MGIIFSDEIAGFTLSVQILCPDCITEDELANIKKECEVITRDFIERTEPMFFCDRCKARL